MLLKVLRHFRSEDTRRRRFPLHGLGRTSFVAFGLAAVLVGAAMGAGAGPPNVGGPFKCQGKGATIVGTARNNTINGTPKADVIVALGGNDTVNGRGGNDRVCGGGGNDTLAGDGGNDRIDGGRGADIVLGGSVTSDDPADPANATALAAGSDGNDLLRGGGGNDVLLGGTGTNTVDGGPGKDSCMNGRATGRHLLLRFDPHCEELPKLVPRLSEIVATFSRPVTTYTVVASGTSTRSQWHSHLGLCGTTDANYTVTSPGPPEIVTFEMTWSHPHPPCPEEDVHPADIGFIAQGLRSIRNPVTGERFHFWAKALYDRGSAPGIGDRPVGGLSVTPG